MTAWLNDNELRAYPLVDDVEGIPPDILVDMRIMYPASLGSTVSVAAVRVTANLVTVVFVVDGRPLCSISELKPLILYKNYQLTPAVDGVGGWIQFGAGINEHAVTFKAIDFEKTAVLPRVAMRYEPAGLTAVGKLHADSQLTGTVRLVAGNGLYVRGADLYVDGEIRRVITIGIDDPSVSKQQLKLYAGDCGARPDDYSCPKQPITAINGVSPDCDGNIELDIQGDIPWGNVVEDGYIVGVMADYPLGFDHVCRDRLQLRPRDDLCTSSEQPGSSESSQGPGPGPFPSSSSSLLPCQPIHGYYEERFNSTGTPHCFTEQSGEWEQTGGRYHGASTMGPGLSILQGSYSKGRILRSEVAVKAGLQQVAYFIFCYRDADNYWYAKVDVAHQKFALGRVRNGIEQDAVDVPDSISADTMYALSLTVHDTGGDSGVIDFYVNGVLRTQLTVSHYLDQGPMGYGVRRSYGMFDALQITLI